MEDVLKYYRERELKEDEFYRDKRYLTLIEDMIDNNINSDDYLEPKKWTGDIDNMFSFLYNNAQYVGVLGEDFDGTLNVKYKESYISLFEMHGQGCFRSIETLRDKPENYVLFNDIVEFVETGVKPVRTQVLDVVNLSLDSLEAISDGLELEIDIKSIRNYLSINLKWFILV